MDFHKKLIIPCHSWIPIIVWQAEGPQRPFGLVFAPCRRAEGLS